MRGQSIEVIARLNPVSGTRKAYLALTFKSFMILAWGVTQVDQIVRVVILGAHLASEGAHHADDE